jgi:pimeloyl-ACP methyl ester carboxylesterase
MGAYFQTRVIKGEFVTDCRYKFGVRVAPLITLLCFTAAQPVIATTLLLKDGRALEGTRYAEISSVAENPLAPKAQSGEVPLTPLLVIDDGLRRTFIHSSQVREILEQNSRRDVRINLWQPVAERGGGVGRIGEAIRVDPFDEFGRRIYKMRSTEGPLSIVQGITQITPLYTRVQGLMGSPRPIVWDMRIATSSIPRETLDRILSTAVKPDDLEGRLQIVRLYSTSERYRDAGAELEKIVKDFPEREDLQQFTRQLRQLGGRLILREIQLRSEAGQHKLARGLLTQFPTEGVSGETLAEVRELLDKYAADDQHREKVRKELQELVAAIGDDNGRRLADGLVKEISEDLNEDTIQRLASFERLADDATMTAEQKVALAMSGWLVGANQATDNFQLAITLAHVRDLVLQFLREPNAEKRFPIMAELVDTEAASVERVAQILKLMKPPLTTPKDAEPPTGYPPRMFELSVAGLPGESDTGYLVQLPPEYDPLRHYPAIVTLADVTASPEQMLDFWAGAFEKDKLGERLGQATRHGYITIAVDWRQPHQSSYEYSAREHHAVLGALRDACRRFAIDSDRVFLTGHGIGGDAVWDIGLAHPDIWAGVVPIVAVADRYCGRYAKNADYLSWYVVAGELDGDKLSRNARELDRYFTQYSDLTVVEYLGRGFEPFGDEIQRLFDWMGRRRRNLPKEMECVSMRPWDNFFWWLEVDGLSERSMVLPGNWPPDRTARPTNISGKRLETNKIAVKVQAEKVIVWLSPELVDFNERLVVEVNNRAISPRDRIVRPDLNVLLQDTRTRGDRQHPFWAKLETP